ncbi:uncharacterized protein EDB91DRAFT_1280551 [Suillus paluster]|uniref:uncharacterized protein n=1 Tax=Suillus paluster TaxID=48578 RepID=UPI001B87C67E|nr:uncharacterized protein EDB91DRAFT_1280551 [Suillus paluster]KAG1720626.1 hypothetical protein EDB91DRAFT_1280551 [Suillus paluster]
MTTKVLAVNTYRTGPGYIYRDPSLVLPNSSDHGQFSSSSHRRSLSTPHLRRLCRFQQVEKECRICSSTNRQIAHANRRTRSRKGLATDIFSAHEASVGDSFSVRIHYKKWLGMKADHEDIVFELEDMFRVSGSEHDRQEYNKIHKKFRIVIKLSGDATTEDYYEGPFFGLTPEAPKVPNSGDRKDRRWQVLVINLAFGVQNAAGEANINTSFISRQNDRFVLHDSKGFEPGGDDNLTILHAIWLCFEIPREGGRLLETGTEEFLTLKREGALGNSTSIDDYGSERVAAHPLVKVPVVVVLTKFDMFIDRVDHTLDESLLEGLSNSAIHETHHEESGYRATGGLHRTPTAICRGLTSPTPRSLVAKEDHKETLAHLIETTESHVRQNFSVRGVGDDLHRSTSGPWTQNQGLDRGRQEKILESARIKRSIQEPNDMELSGCGSY